MGVVGYTWEWWWSRHGGGGVDMGVGVDMRVVE